MKSPQRPARTGTEHDLPFHQLSWRQFEQLCVRLLDEEGFCNVEHYGAVGRDGGRDITATDSRGRFTIAQCKRYAPTTPFGVTSARQMIDDLLHPLDQAGRRPRRRPEHFVLLMTRDISADVRDVLQERLGDVPVTFWDLERLDRDVRRHPAIRDKFFTGWVAAEASPQAPMANDTTTGAIRTADVNVAYALGLLRTSNQAALELYTEHVKGETPTDGRTPEARRALAGDYWTARNFADLRKDVKALREDKPIPIQPALCMQMREAKRGGERARLWLVGESGQGKTTTLYQIYFAIAKANNDARQDDGDDGGGGGGGDLPYPEPMLIQFQKIETRQAESLRRSARDLRALRQELFQIWIRRRRFQLSELNEAAAIEGFVAAVESGRIVLLIDSYDELRRMSLQMQGLGPLLDTCWYYVCATRPEFASDAGGQQKVTLQRHWGQAILKEYLEQSLPQHTGWVPRILRRVHRNGWLRNPRYLSMLVQLLGRQDAGRQPSQSLPAIIEKGQYSLLSHIFKSCLDRVKGIEFGAGRPVGPDFDSDFRRRLVDIAKVQLTTGVTVIPEGPASDDPYFNALTAASDIVRHIPIGDEHHFSLINYNWVDFFLADNIYAELMSVAGRPAVPHLWTRNLLTYLVEFVCRPECGEDLDHFYTVVHAQLDDCRLDSLDPSEPFRPRPRHKDLEIYRAVNLVHLLVEIKRHQRAQCHTADDSTPAIHFENDDLTNLYLDAVDLSAIECVDCDFSGSQMTQAHLERTVFEECSFKGTNLRGARASFANFHDCTFDMQTGSRNRADAPSPVLGMLIQGASFEAFEDQRAELLAAGARGQGSRYDSPFGRRFFENQRAMLGKGFRRTEHEYFVHIKAALDGAVARSGGRPLYLVDLMAGGSNERLIKLLKSYRDLYVLAVDRDGSRMGPIADAFGKRFALHEFEIGGAFDLAGILDAHFGTRQAHVVIGKKALHELPRASQIKLIGSVFDTLTDLGRLVLFLDSPTDMSAEGYARLTELKRRFIEVARRDHLPELRNLLLKDFEIPDSTDGCAIFSNLWVHVKDWSNGNERELVERYFSSVSEVDRWTRQYGAVRVGPIYADIYRLSARLFNEVGLNKAALFLDRCGTGRPGPAVQTTIREALEGDARHHLFRDFVERHLFANDDVPSPLGKRLGARRVPINFKGLESNFDTQALGLDSELGIDFRFTIHVAAFEKQGAPTPPTDPV